MSIKQDRIGTRTSEDLRRRLNVKAIDESIEKVDKSAVTVEQLNAQVVGMSDSLDNTRSIYVSTQQQTFTEEQKTRARNNIGAGSSSYTSLTNKPSSLSHINAVEGSKLNGIEAGAQKNVLEKIYISGEELTPTNKAVNIYVDDYTSRYSTNPVQNKAITTYVSERTGATTYGLSTYKVSDLSILRSSCVLKNNRVCISFVGTLSMSANTTTTLFNLPADIRPTATKDFVVFGQSSNNDGYIGYGYVTSDGLLQVRFNEDISSYIRFSTVYDLD